MWTSPTKKYLLFFTTIMFIGFIGGIFFINKIDDVNREIIFNNINNWLGNLPNIRINYIVIHLLIILLFMFLAYFVIGMPFYLIYLFYHGFSLGFILASLGSLFGIKGYLFSLIYLIIVKGIYTICLLIIAVFIFKISKYSFYKFLNKMDKNQDMSKKFYKKSFIILLFIFISDLIIYFLGSSLVNIFKFLIN